MTAELKPCPFCGKTKPVEVEHREATSMRKESYRVVCNSLKGGCGGSCGFRATEDEAITHWNTRAERTCIIINQPDAEGCNFWVCSVCGFPYTDGNNHCPGCGAKVVNNGD